MTRCPKCKSPEPRLHPATGADGGEVAYICPDEFHKGPNGGLVVNTTLNDQNMERLQRLDSDDWTLIQEVLDAARLEDHPGKAMRIHGLAAALLKPRNRPLCNQCDHLPVDLYGEDGLCARCSEQNALSALMPDDFDGDGDQLSLMEHAVKEMTKTWEAAKDLQGQCERIETDMPEVAWYLWTQEVRNIMGWSERENEIYTRYFYEPEKQSSPVGTACACDHHGDHAGCNSDCECAR